MSVPETSVHEHHLMPSWKDKVGLSGKIFAVQAEPVTKTVNQAAERELWIRVFAAYAPHVGTAPLLRNLIHTANG